MKTPSKSGRLPAHGCDAATLLHANLAEAFLRVGRPTEAEKAPRRRPCDGRCPEATTKKALLRRPRARLCRRDFEAEADAKRVGKAAAALLRRAEKRIPTLLVPRDAPTLRAAVSDASCALVRRARPLREKLVIKRALALAGDNALATVEGVEIHAKGVRLDRVDTTAGVRGCARRGRRVPEVRLRARGGRRPDRRRGVPARRFRGGTREDWRRRERGRRSTRAGPRSSSAASESIRRRRSSSRTWWSRRAAAASSRSRLTSGATARCRKIEQSRRWTTARARARAAAPARRPHLGIRRRADASSDSESPFPDGIPRSEPLGRPSRISVLNVLTKSAGCSVLVEDEAEGGDERRFRRPADGDLAP